jgi:mannose-6-phosphate isomerase-like protein (cupin superfamily)
MPRRRVVTGHDAEGKSIILSDGPSPGRFASGEWEELWAFGSLPASLTDATDPADRETFRLVPSGAGIACRMVEWPAAGESTNPAADPEFAQRMDWAETELPDRPGDLMWHRTPTVDIFVVISGELELVLDSGETARVGPGDAVIQRGTMHAWRNLGSERCVAVSFMVRAG